EVRTADPPMGDGESSPAHGAAPGSSGSAGAQPPTVRIGVAHAPYQRVLGGMPALGCTLVLAAHTHGRPLCLPAYRPLVANCALDTGRAGGLHPWPGEPPGDGNAAGAGNLRLHVSNGMGTNPFTPVRLACRPSVTLVTLTPPR